MIGDYCPDRAASMLPTPRRRAVEVMNSVAAWRSGTSKPKDKCADFTAQGQPRSAQSHRRRAERQSATNCWSRARSHSSPGINGND